MASRAQAVLIFGATGLIGKYISDAILSSASEFRRIGVFTSSDTLKNKADEMQKLKSRGAEIITGDINQEQDLVRAFKGFDTIVSCLGRTVLHAQVDLARIADQHPDVKRFFPSEYGTDIEHGPDSAHEKPHQQKLKVRKQLRSLKNLEYTCIVTGPYGNADFGLYLGATPIEKEKTGTFDVKRKRAVILGTGDDKISLTTMRDTGKFVVAALKNLRDTANRILLVNSFTTTPRQIVEEFERQTGQAWNTSITDLDELKVLEEDGWTKGDPMAGAVTLKRIWTEGGTLHEHRDNNVLGLENNIDDLNTAIKDAIEWQTKSA